MHRRVSGCQGEEDDLPPSQIHAHRSRQAGEQGQEGDTIVATDLAESAQRDVADLDDVTEVDIAPADPQRFAAVLSAEQFAALSSTVERARRMFDGVRIWNINSTAQGGGVAEMLSTLLPYARGAGVDAGWMVITGDDEFFTITKRIHNRLHGAPGDGAELNNSDRRHYEAVLTQQAAQIRERLRPRDIVILHDPQTAGLAPLLNSLGVGVAWRCHVGLDTPNALARDTWQFLLPYVRAARLQIFSRRVFAWEGTRCRPHPHRRSIDRPVLPQEL